MSPQSNPNRAPSNRFPARFDADVLIALMGNTPATLTETVWALAHENPPLIPHQVIVLTTMSGQNRLKSTLFDQRGWDRLKETLELEGCQIRDRLRFGLARDHVRLLPCPDGSADLEDIVTSADSEAAADFMMRSLLEFTETAGTRIMASIAGGRKTMAALLTSCMVLLGRSQDRLCHVLVDSPFDSPALDPPFLFPEPECVHRLPGHRQPFHSNTARVELTEIPFVRVRGWYEREYRQTLPSFMSMVRRVQGLAPAPIRYPSVVVNLRLGAVKIDRKRVALNSSEFAIFSIVLKRLLSGKMIRNWYDIEGEIVRLQAVKDIPLEADWIHEFRNKTIDLKEDPRKLAASIRRKLRPHMPQGLMPTELLPTLRKPNARLYPRGKIRIIE